MERQFGWVESDSRPVGGELDLQVPRRGRLQLRYPPWRVGEQLVAYQARAEEAGHTLHVEDVLERRQVHVRVDGVSASQELLVVRDSAALLGDEAQREHWTSVWLAVKNRVHNVLVNLGARRRTAAAARMRMVASR